LARISISAAPVQAVLGDVAGDRRRDQAIDAFAGRDALADPGSGDFHRRHVDEQRPAVDFLDPRAPGDRDARQTLHLRGATGAELGVLVGADQEHQRRSPPG
jgi:hypothetical protein